MLAAPRVENDWPRHICLCRDKLVAMGGAERVFIEQAETLVGRGIRCTLVLSELADSFGERLPREASTYVLGSTCRYCDLAFFPKLLKLSWLLRRLQPDCVIAHQSLADYLYWALKGTDIPYFLLKYESNFYLPEDRTKYSFLYRNSFHRLRDSLLSYIEAVPVSWDAGPFRRLLNEYWALRDWLGIRGARGVFTLTSHSQWELQQLYNINAVVWTPGSHQHSRLPSRDDAAIRTLRDRYGIRADQSVILSVNRLDSRKRIHILVEAFRLLSVQGVCAKLILVGEGEQREDLEQQVRDAGLDGTVEFTGLVSDELLVHHYHMCDVAVAIMWGAWGLSIVEPLLYNKKVLISDELPDLLAGVPNLFRVKPEPVAVCKGLEQALLSPSQNSADIVMQQLNWDRQMDRLLAHIRSHD